MSSGTCSPVFLSFTTIRKGLYEMGLIIEICLHLADKYPKFKDKSNQIFGGDEKHNEVREVVKSESVDSLNDQRLDASTLSFSVMVGSSEHLVRCQLTSLFTIVSYYFTNV